MTQSHVKSRQFSHVNRKDTDSKRITGKPWSDNNKGDMEIENKKRESINSIDTYLGPQGIKFWADKCYFM